VTVHDKVATNVELDSLESAARELSAGTYDEIVAVGGGSTIDAAKVLSQTLLAPDPGALRCHLEGVESMPVTDTPLPVIAVPTTAGTGAEVTPFATVWDSVRLVKHSFALGEPYPRVALLDPELTLRMPARLTLTTGLDALCQGLESLWSVGSNPVSTVYAQRAVRIALDTLPVLMRKLGDLTLRSSMLEASLMAGLAIGISRTTLSHSISHPLTLRFGVPHGLACAFTIAQVLRFNAEDNPTRLDQIARDVGADDAGMLADQISELLADTGAYGGLGLLKRPDRDVLAVAAEAITSGRTDNNPRPASVADIAEILTSSLACARGYT
jgi:alcohol dehydrogenase